MEKQPKSLLEFYQDTDTKNNVHAYLIEFCREEALKDLFENEGESDAYTIAQAKKVIDRAFENMDVIFSPKAGKKAQVNEAR